jgi:hypothetical protein
MRKFLILAVILALFVGYFVLNYTILYTKDFYYGYLIIKKDKISPYLIYVDYDKLFSGEKDKVARVIKKNEWLKKHSYIKKALIEAKVISK